MRHRRGGEPGFSRALAELKRRGCGVLVVGDVPETAVDHISARFLGRAPSRVRAFALWDVGLDRVERRLRAAGPGREPVIVVDAGPDGARSVGADAAGTPVPYLDVRTVEPDLGSLKAGTVAAVEDARRRHGPLDPADLRVCVDVLRGPVGDADVGAYFDAVLESVVEAGGMVHALVPADPTAAVAGTLRPRFDVVVELRSTNGTAEQRWTVPEHGVETGWTKLTGP